MCIPQFRPQIPPVQHEGTSSSVEYRKTLKMPDECVECSQLIASNLQIAHPGIDLCGRCAGLVDCGEER